MAIELWEGSWKQCHNGVKGNDHVYLMKLKIMSWNVRGAKDGKKRKLVKAMVRQFRLDLICLQDTKIQEMSMGLSEELLWEEIWIGVHMPSSC